MATSRRRTAKKDVGQNLGELESRVKKVERRPRASIGSFSITSDLIAPGSITIDKLDPALLALLQDIADNAGSAGDSSEYLVSGGEDGEGLVTGVVDSVISQYDFSTTSASGKNSIYWQSTEPTGGDYVDGDIWYDTSLSPVDNLPQYTPHRYDEAAGDWVAAEFGDGAFRFIDAGKISTGILDAGIAIRVGTYPLDSAIVGKSRVEIASTFPTRLPAVGEDPTTIPTFSGIRVLRKTASNQTETTGFYPSLLINADTGDFRVGGSSEFFGYSASTDKVTLSGKILTGADVNGNATAESLLIGTDVTGTGQDGIRMGPYNYWYRPASVTSSSDLIFKVGSSGTEGLTVTKSGAVNFEGTANPTGGTIKGRLSVRLGEGNASDKFIIGQNVPSLSGLTGDEFDGIKLDTNNYWVLSNTAKKAYLRVGTSTKNLSFDGATGLLKLTGGDITLTGGGTFKTADSNTRVEMTSDGIFGYKTGTTDPIFYIRASDGKASFEGETNPTGGTVKGKLTIQGTTYAFGKDVVSTKDGLYLNANNYWTLSQTGATAEFKVGGNSKYLEWTGGQLNIRTDTLLIGDQTAATQAYADSAAGSAFSSINVLQKLNDSITGVSITSLGYIFSAGKTTYQSDVNGWFIGYNEPPFANPRTPVMYIGNATNYMKWTGSSLDIKGNITGSTFTGGTFRTGSTTENRVEMIDDSERDRIRFPLPKSPGGATLSPVESSPAQIRVVPTTVGDGSFFRVLELTSATVSGWRPAPKMSFVTGTGSTSNTESVLSVESLRTWFRGPSVGQATDMYLQGRLIVQSGTLYDGGATQNSTVLFGSPSAPSMSLYATSGGVNTIDLNTTSQVIGITDDSGTPSRVMGRNASGYLRWYTSVGGSGGYSNATDGTTTNKITYGGSPPGTGTGRSAGDIHIEF